jgi:peptide/nickel transport system permease protein
MTIPFLARRAQNRDAPTWRTNNRPSIGQGLAAVFLGLVLIVAAFASVLAPHDPNGQALARRLQPPVWQGGTWEFVLGTDELGRDLLSRIMFGAQTSVAIGLAVVLLTLVVGTALGILAGYIGGWFDTAVMWVCDVVLSLPGLLLSAVLVFVFGASMGTVIVALSIEGWLVYCRMARGMVLQVRRTAYVDAARTIGASPVRLLLRHVLPNISSPIVTLATLEFARIVLAEAALSFLGYGIQPPLVSWGLMINSGGPYLTVAWWLITLPGLVLTLTVLSANVLSDWLRNVTDPLQSAGAAR